MFIEIVGELLVYIEKPLLKPVDFSDSPAFKYAVKTQFNLRKFLEGPPHVVGCPLQSK